MEILEKVLCRERLIPAHGQDQHSLYFCANTSGQRAGTERFCVWQAKEGGTKVGAEDGQLQLEQRLVLVTRRVSNCWNSGERNCLV